MKGMTADDDTRESRWNFQPRDQIALAVIYCFLLVLLGGYWWWSGVGSGAVIEIDRAQPIQFVFQADINHASWEELTLLPEIGEQLAKRIVEYREEHGPFGDLNELRQVRGLGPRTLERIRPYLLPLPDQENIAGQTFNETAG